MTEVVRPSTVLKDNVKTKTITLFINGKNQHYMCEINPMVTKTWPEVLTFMGSTINPQFGSVKKLIALSSLQPVNSFHALNSKEKYIVLGEGEKFKRAPNGYIIPSKDDNTKKSRTSSVLRKLGAVTDIKTRQINKESQQVSIPKNGINTNLNVKAGYSNNSEIKAGQQKPSNDKKATNRYLYNSNQRNTNQKAGTQQNNKMDAIQKRFTKPNNVNNQSGKYSSKESTPCVNKEKTISGKPISQPQRKPINKGLDESNQSNIQEYSHDAVNTETIELVHTCASPIKPPSSEMIHSTTSPFQKLNYVENTSSTKDIYEKKNIFHPSPTTSIKNIAWAAKASNNESKSDMTTTHLAEISPNKVPQVIPIKKLVIPYESIAERMEDLKVTILACKHNISQINKRIYDECKKYEKTTCFEDFYSKEKNTRLPKPNPSKKAIKDTASIETVQM
ncbi:putative uncharacterized protein DDB_G0282133 [Diorhabda carinulata]|uniref:putative uncharacterized protein DDB_G0282133 n=1 Tax=Diorhabda carinulata TaxID=1163345 RepID=UPI0025A0B9F0|nr:putative uncharacterized protein DDB_G0282133 [Diorhabda carinulata]